MKINQKTTKNLHRKYGKTSNNNFKNLSSQSILLPHFSVFGKVKKRDYYERKNTGKSRHTRNAKNRIAKKIKIASTLLLLR